MGIAILFLIALDALILSGPHSQFRVDLALIISFLVALSISLIWRRNTRLERLSKVKGAFLGSRPRACKPRFV